jgi:glucarate dehydratase
MKIVDIELIKVNVPLEAPLIWTGGQINAFSRIIVRMKSDEGIEGFAETQGGDAVMALLVRYKDFFIGRDPAHLESIRTHFWHTGLWEGMTGKHATSALETCCWDILGKAYNRSVAELIGGRVRDSIPCAGYLFPQAGPAGGEGDTRYSDALIDQARSRVGEHGVRTLKLKGGMVAPETDLATLRTLREQYPDHRIRYDPNSAWSVASSVRLARQLEELDLEWAEDLVWGFDAMRRARAACRVPFATNMTSVQPDQMPMALQMQTIDVQLLDPLDIGGLIPTMKMAATCQSFGLDTGVHSAGESGLGLALMLHIASVLPTFPFAMDTHIWFQTDDLLDTPIKVVDGQFQVPTGPGLGVTVDEERLAYLSRVNAESGDSLNYGEPAGDGKVPFAGWL